MQPKPNSQSLFSKILHFPVTRAVLGFVGVLLTAGIVQGLGILFPDDPSGGVSLLVTTASVIAACLFYAGYVHLLEKRPVSELALAGAARELGLGVLVGAGLFGLTIGFLWLAGYYRVSGVNTWNAMLPALVLAMMAGVVEELLFRGIFFRLFEESFGTWLALVVSALFFGISHLFNPNASLAAALAIALEAGVLLSAAFILTRRLWLAIGIHFAWNFVQGGIFGVAVSGIDMPGLLQANLEGPALLTGGGFGAEASIIAVAVCLLAGIMLLRSARGRFVQPYWKR